MNHSTLCRTVTLSAALLMAAGAQAGTMSKPDYTAAKDRIKVEYNHDKANCKQLSGNANDICAKQAKGKEEVALAELEYGYSGKTADANKVDVAKADATFAVAKERCDDLAGNPKSVCMSEAQAAHTKALADAKMAKKVDSARQDAAADKVDADYKLAREKCDSLAGDAQASCISAAKVRYGRT
jgi:hypothetical protein